MIFIIFFLLILILLACMIPKSKLLFIIELLVNIIIIGGYNGVGDLDNYMYKYQNGIITEGIFEKLFDIVANFFKNAGVSFEMFHLILSIVAICIMGYVIYKLSNKPALALALFTGYSTFEYALQLKSMCAAAILLLAIYYFYKNIYQKKCSIRIKLIYILLILLATGFHFMSLFFITFLFMNSINIGKIKKIVIPLTIIITIFSQNIISMLSNYIDNLSFYVGMNRGLLTTVAFCLWQIGSLVIIRRIMHFNKKQNVSDDISNFDKFVYDGSWILLLIMPFYSITFVINRLLKVWSAFFYIQASNINLKRNTLSLNLFSMFAYSFGSFVLFYFILQNNSNYNVVLDIIQNNMFIGGVF